MKKLTAKQNLSIANALMGAGVIYNLYDMWTAGIALRLVPTLISVALVVIGAVYSALFVRCPHCGDRLKGQKNKLPERCPVCNGRLDRLPKSS